MQNSNYEGSSKLIFFSQNPDDRRDASFGCLHYVDNDNYRDDVDFC